MRALAVLLIAACACSSSPKSSPTPIAPPPVRLESKITGGAVKFTDWAVSVLDSLFFTDGGQRLVAAGRGSIVEIDPVARKQVGAISLSSARVPNPRSRPGLGETLSWEVHESVWAWDADSIVGVAQLIALGDAASGLSVWRPASGAPIKIPAAIGYLFACAALLPDGVRRALGLLLSRAAA